MKLENNGMGIEVHATKPSFNAKRMIMYIRTVVADIIQIQKETDKTHNSILVQLMSIFNLTTALTSV